MKKLFFGLVILLAQNVFCQDSIYKKNGEIIASRVLEISDSEVKFKKAQNLEGPTYAELKSGLIRIKFENGTIDTIKSQIEVNPQIVTETITINQKQASPKQSLMYKRMNDSEIYSIIELLPSSDSKTRMKREYALMRQFKSNQYLAGTLGFVIGFTVPVVATIAAFGSYGSDPGAVIVVGALVGAAIRTTG